MNQPEKCESYVLAPDEPKLEYKKDHRIANSGIFKINKEDHTMGNLLRMQLLNDKRVLFSGYKVPHPLEHVLELKVRTNGKITPKQAMCDTIDSLQQIIEHSKKQFNKELRNYNLKS